MKELMGTAICLKCGVTQPTTIRIEKCGCGSKMELVPGTIKEMQTYTETI